LTAVEALHGRLIRAVTSKVTWLIADAAGAVISIAATMEAIRVAIIIEAAIGISSEAARGVWLEAILSLKASVSTAVPAVVGRCLPSHGVLSVELRSYQ
jgi:hypothetical protein